MDRLIAGTLKAPGEAAETGGDPRRVEALLRPLHFHHYEDGNLSKAIVRMEDDLLLDAWAGTCKGVVAMRRGVLSPSFPIPKIQQLETRGGWVRNVSAPNATSPLLRQPVQLFPAAVLPLGMLNVTAKAGDFLMIP